MSKSLPSHPALRRRFLGVARLTFIFALAAASLASAQITPPTAAPVPAPVTPVAPVNTGGGRRGGGRAAAAAAAVPGAAGTGANTGGFGRRGGGPAAGGFAGRGGLGAAAGPAQDPLVAAGVVETAVPAGGTPENIIGATAGAANPLVTAEGVPPDSLDPNEPVMTQLPGVSAAVVLEWLQRNSNQVILSPGTLPVVQINYSTVTGAGTYLPRGQVVKELENLLAMNGIIIVPNTDNTLRAVASGSLSGIATKLITPADGSDIYDTLAKMPPSEEVYGAIFPLKYLNPLTEIQGTLGQFMSDKGSSIVILPKDNSILVTDMLINLQRVAEVIKAADVPVTPMETVIFKVLKNAQAQTLVTSLTTLTAAGTPLARYFGNNTTFTPDLRTNAIVAVTAKSNEALVNSLVDSFDQNVDPTTQSDVFRLKQADSGNTSTILKTIVTGSQAATPAAGGGRGAAAAPAPNPTSASQQFSQYVTITNDVRTNSIVAYGTPRDLQQIKDLIDKIDIILPEVEIDAVVTEVTLTKDQVSGLSNFAAAWDFLPSGSTNPTDGSGNNVNRNFSTATLTPATGSAPAFTLAGSLQSMNLGAVLNVAKNDSNVRVIDSPRIVTTHAQRGYITVGETVPVLSASTVTVQTPPTSTNTVTSKNIDVNMTITPFIGTDGSVYMAIDQQVNDIIGNVLINGVDQPIIGTREVTANVTVHDGGILVLGGLRERHDTTSHGVVFLLGEIPILGQLFQPDENETVTTELIVFIQPHIIKDTPSEQYLARQVSGASDAQDTSVNYMRNDHIQNGSIEKPNSSIPYIKNPISNTVVYPDNYPVSPPASGTPPSASSAPPVTDPQAAGAGTSNSSNSQDSSAAVQPIDTSGGFRK